MQRVSEALAKNLNSTARPFDQQAFSQPDPTAIWHSHLALARYIFVVVNFDALVQASDFRIERRQVFFLCWMQDSNPEGLWNQISSRLNACWQTDRAIEDQAKNLYSTARPYDQQAFSPPDPAWKSQIVWLTSNKSLGLPQTPPSGGKRQVSDSRVKPDTFRGLFYCHRLTLVPSWVRITYPAKCEMKLLTHSQTSTNL